VSAGGAGIGLSDHTTTYSNGVLSGDNWVEEKFAKDHNNPPPMWHGGGGALESTTQASFVPEGKFGGQIAENLGMAEEIKFQRRGVSNQSLFGHYPDFTERPSSFVSTAALHFSAPEKAKPRAQAGLWAPSHKHNVNVPTMSAAALGSSALLTRGKKTAFGSDAPPARPGDAFRTTNDCTLGETGRLIAGGGVERRGAQAHGPSGRKPVGEFNRLADARSRRAALRA